MFLESITLQNYRCFEELNIEFHDRLTVIVGSNGAGKTTILEGAATAAGSLYIAFDSIPGMSITKMDAHLKSFSMGSIEDVQPQYPVEIHAKGTIEGETITWKRKRNSASGITTTRDARQITAIGDAYQKRLRSGDISLKLPLIVYYGTGRLWDNHREKKNDAFAVSTRTNGYIDSLDGVANLKLMMNWFKKMTILKYQRQEEDGGTIPELDVVYQAMENCYTAVTGYSKVKMQYNLNTNEIDVHYTSEGKRMRIALSQLSDGYKGIVSLIADIAYRMAVLNPQLLKEVLKETEGIVLIDEIDLHLHPAWQQRVLGDLMQIFPKIQFVVSTHAPAVLHSVKSENLVILKECQVLGINSEIYGNDVKSILSEVMEVKDRPPKVAEMFERFYHLLQDKNYKEAEQILDEIDTLRDYHDQEVAGCRVKLKLERIRGGQL